MSKPNASKKKTRWERFGDRILRALGIHRRSSPQITSSTTAGANSSITPAPEATQSPLQSGSNLALQFRELIPIMTTTEPFGRPGKGLVVPTPPLVVRHLAPPLHSPETPASRAGREVIPITTTSEPLGGPIEGLVVPAPPLVFRSSEPPLSTPPTPASRPGAVSDKSEVGGLWARALERLSKKDKKTLESNKTGSHVDIEELLGEVHEKREMCLENQWEFKFRGRTVNLRYQADKILSWLAKFKEVGDIAIQQDPSHAALPWAGIRFLLQMSIAERDQMEFLLTGVERLTNTISRCRIYEILYLDGVQYQQTEDSINPAFEHLSAALISLYAVVLRFLAKAYRAFSKSGVRRAQHATFSPGKFGGILEESQVLDVEVVAAVGNCKEACNRNAHRNTDRLFGILKNLEEPVQRTYLGVQALLRNVDTERRTRILQWISAIPYEDNHNTAAMGHTSGTGEWLLQHDTYIRWRISPACGILWLYGIPGAGKTKLVSTVVNSLRRGLVEAPQGEALAYFYCDRNQADRQSPEQVMRSFVRQLSTPRDSDMIPTCIDKCYSGKERPGFASSSLTFQECSALVRELVAMYTKVTLILDALDECDRSTRHDLVNEIDDLVSRSASCVVKVFISSRPDRDIQHRFRVGPNVCIRATDNGEDIRKFIVHTIDNSPQYWLAMVTSTTGLREEIVNTLHKKADGMFQWAKLQMGQLLRLPNVLDIRDFLGKLPEDLERAYKEIMDQINSQRGRSPEIARRAFLWVMCSHRPLSHGMLVDAVSRDLETGAANLTGLDINIVLEACRNLLTIDQSGVCRFSHLSVQEYLEAHHYSNGRAHSVVGSVCLRVLLDPKNWPSIKSLPSFYEDPGEEKDILRYIVAYWPYHVQLHTEESVDDRLKSLVKEFLGSPNKSSMAYECWSHKFPVYIEQGEPFYKGRFPGLSSPAFAVVIFSLNKILESEWISSLDVDLMDEEGQSLLYIAVKSDNLSAARELLNLGANPNIQGDQFGSSLQAAASQGNEAIAHLLLDRGASINTQGGLYGNGLQAAAARGNEVIARLLLDRGADINAQGGIHGSALQAAVFGGNDVIFRLLLKRGANINAQGGEYGNALQAAVVQGNDVILRLLLELGADINAQGGKYGNALQAAVAQGNEVIVHLLLDRGADINSQGGGYGNALLAAVVQGNGVIARLLLDRGADINAQGGGYGNALQAAVVQDNGVIFRLLLGRGADINAQGGKYGNALQAAVVQDNDIIFRLLLGREININAQGGKYGNALQAAVARGNEVSVRLLLDRGADINAQGGEYGNALQAAVVQGNDVIFRLLLKRGANINAQGGEYGNALQAALVMGNEAIARLLLDRGADINAPGGGYGNALQAAVVQGSEVIVRHLLDQGAYINAQGGKYGNALQAAVVQGNGVIVRLLLDRGADINAEGGFLGTALEAAVVQGNGAIVHFLLDRGADIDESLRAATAEGREAISRFLLDRGTNIEY